MSNIAFTAPHAAATEAGMQVLREGGSAVEAMVAAAATIAVVYPHMNSLGGDSFWLVDEPGLAEPVAIDACGRSASRLADNGPLPTRGGSSCITQAATLRGWQAALQLAGPQPLPLGRLLQPAIRAAAEGFAVSDSLATASRKLHAVAERNQAFRDVYEPQERPLQAGERFCNPAMAATLTQLAQHGLDDFYHGELAQRICTTLQREGSPLLAVDHAATTASLVKPLSVAIEGAQLYNLPAPTQGVASLMILAIADRLRQQVDSEADLVHLLVESTKRSFAWRNQHLTDPQQMSVDCQQVLDSDFCAQAAASIEMQQASPWPVVGKHADTVWMGARDARGQMVSFIQSIYWEFGSGIAIEGSGFVWNNRGVSFSNEAGHPNELAPGKKPFHTLNPALARFTDGRRLSYGTMGGEGQPQTQAAVFARHVWQGLPLVEAVARERWLLGRTWGDSTDSLKLEQSLADAVLSELLERGHDCESVADRNEMMGHAGAIIETPVANGGGVTLDAATDPRSDGAALTGSYTINS